MFGKHRAQSLRIMPAALVLSLLWYFAGGVGWAQEKPECERGLSAVGYLGISELEGSREIYVKSTDEQTVALLRFLSEPRVVNVDPEGPSRGKIKIGDFIFAINGQLITTERAGRLFANPPVGEPIELGIRTDGGEVQVTVMPTWICPDDPRALMSRWIREERIVLPEARSEPPSPPRTSKPEPTVRPEPVFPHVWMGIGLECSIDGHWATDDLRFTEPPTVFRVEPDSKADEAGLRPRDILTHIDGIPLDTLEGTKRFTEIKPGEQIEWTVRRGRRPHTVEMEAAPIPRRVRLAMEGLPAPAPREPEIDDLRYVGALGTTAIEVRGLGPVNVTVDEERGEIIIQTADATIRLKTTKQPDEG